MTMKKSSVIAISCVCGFLASVATYILIAWAAQTWPVTTSGTGHQTDHLTYIPQRDDSLRANFSGTTCPGSPVEGQHCYDTDDDLLYVYENSAWVEVLKKDSCSSITDKDTTSHTFTRVGNICVDAAFPPPILVLETASDKDDTTIDLPSGVEGVFITGHCRVVEDSGAPNGSEAAIYVFPYDAGNQSPGIQDALCHAYATDANEAESDIGSRFIKAGSGGDIEYEWTEFKAGGTPTTDGYIILDAYIGK